MRECLLLSGDFTLIVERASGLRDGDGRILYTEYLENRRFSANCRLSLSVCFTYGLSGDLVFEGICAPCPAKVLSRRFLSHLISSHSQIESPDNVSSGSTSCCLTERRRPSRRPLDRALLRRRRRRSPNRNLRTSASAPRNVPRLPKREILEQMRHSKSI